MEALFTLYSRVEAMRVLTLTQFKANLDKAHTKYREVPCGDVIKIMIYGLNAPEVWKFKQGKYWGRG